MKHIKNIYSVLFFLLLAIVCGCSKTGDSFYPDGQYHTVSDVVQYCSGSCDSENDWEGNDIRVKGHIRNRANDGIMNTYFAGSYFYLEDIRNGFFMEIRVVASKGDIFDRITQSIPADIFYITGKAVAVEVDDGENCEKGVIIELDNIDNILLNAE
ncbi:MAG: hypothetical protein KDC05_15750 [Bacteroidales bacterium]|nr:hypothetical protein [Bacteroidales bacterium]